MALDYDNNRDGTVTVYPAFIADDPMYRRDGFGVRLDESELRTLLRTVEES
jgi:hypothetical protein